MRKREMIWLTKRFLQSFVPYQQRWLLDGSKFKIGLWARQTGKDFTCAAEAALDCMANPHRHWLILACGERQACESLLKAREWACQLNDLLGRRQKSFALHQSSTEIRFENGSRITALPARPETVRGYSANIILTEFAFVHDADAIWQAIFPSVTNPLSGGEKRVRIISTPAGQGNLFHQLWQGEGSSADLFSRHRITIHDAVSQGLPLSIPQLKAGIVSPEAWSQEYECEFIDTSRVLLPYELIERSESPEATQACDLSRLSGEVFVGIDFGRKKDITACWVLERVGKELWTREVLILEQMSTPSQAELLSSRVNRARRVCLDYTGPGIGLGDMLSQGTNHKLELCTFTSAFKGEIFPRLRAAMERGELRIPSSAAIRADLHGVHRFVSEQGAFSYRATHGTGGHSDRCTALALALRAAESAPQVALASNVGRRFSISSRH